MLSDNHRHVEQLKEFHVDVRSRRGQQGSIFVETRRFIARRVQRGQITVGLRHLDAVDLKTDRANMRRSIEKEKTCRNENQHACDTMRLSIGRSGRPNRSSATCRAASDRTAMIIRFAMTGKLIDRVLERQKRPDVNRLLIFDFLLFVKREMKGILLR